MRLRFLPTRPKMIRLILIYLAVSLSVAASGTSPSEPPYVSGPSGRGTIGLIWSCILTLWPSVWTAIHLNMPHPDWTWRRRFLKKLKYAGCALVLPEIILAYMLVQFFATWALTKDMNAIIDKQDIETGSAEPRADLNHHGCPASTITSETKSNRWNLTISFFASRGGFKLKCGDGAGFKKDRYGRPQYTIRPDVFIAMARKGIFLPVNDRLCQGKGKSDAIGKLFVVGQVSWFMLQCVARKASGLPVTLLEINTVVHVACAIAIFLLMFRKPKDATEPIEFDVTTCSACREFFLQSKHELYRVVNTDAAYDFKNVQWAGNVSLFALSAMYGGLHAVAWDAHFPSYPEQIIWRVSVLFTAVSSILLLYGLDDFNKTNAGKFVLAIAILPRLYLVLEAFISVRSLPVGAYQTVEWVGFLPHIG